VEVLVPLTFGNRKKALSTSVLLLVYFWFPLSLFKDSINGTSSPDQLSVAASPYLRQTPGVKLAFPELKFLWNFDAIKQFPMEPVFLGFLLIFTFSILSLRVMKFDISNVFSFKVQNKLVVTCVGTFFAILHTGLLSPYTTNYFYSRASDLQNRWYTVFLLNGTQGGVNADYFVFRNLDYIYWGGLYDGPSPDGQLIRRSIFNYILSTPNYFINSYCTWLVINLVLLSVTMMFVHELLSQQISLKIAGVISLLFGTSLPVMLYFGSPWSYFAGICSSVLLIFSFIKFIVLGPGLSRLQNIYFGLFASILSLTYDLVPILIGLLFYCIIYRRQVTLLIGILWAIFLPSLVSFIYESQGGSTSGSNSKYIGESLRGILGLISNHEYHFMLSKTAADLLNYPSFLEKVVGLPAICLAVLGFITFNNIKIKSLTILLLLSSIFVYLFFSIPNSELSDYPRIHFHPLGILIFLAGFGLNFLVKLILKLRASATIQKLLINGVFGLLILWMLYLGNSDLFGKPDRILGIQFDSQDTSGVDWRKSDLSWNGELIPKG